MSIAVLTTYLLKALAISCNSVKLRPLTKILDGATLGNSFKGIVFSILFHLLFKSFRFFWEEFVKQDLLLSLIRVDNRFLHCLYLIWASFFKVTSFNLMYLISTWLLTKIEFRRPRVIHGLFLNFNFYLKIFFRGAYKSKIELNLVRKLPKHWSILTLFDLL